MNLKRILIPTDFSPASHDAFLMAVDIANTWQAALTVAHVVEPFIFTVPEALVDASLQQRLQEQADQSLAEWRAEAEKHDVRRVETRRLDGAAWHAIVEEAARGEHDMIVMGTHGRTGLKHTLLGSVAERVVRHAPCPVLVIRPKRRPVAGPL